MAIRNAAKALILRDGKMLINQNQNSLGDMCYGMPHGQIYYDLPGGGQNQYETLEEAVARECLEETGYAVSVDRLCAIYEEITMHEGFRQHYADYAHKVHFVFLCRIAAEAIQPTAEKDLDMLTSKWVDLADIRDLPLYPETIRDNLDSILQAEHVLYLGAKRI